MVRNINLSRPFFSICIPAYNRLHHLAELLNSILAQDFDSYEILMCEDMSPQRPQIASAMADYQKRYPGKIRYHENPVNLGYDANIRNLVALAQGEYCFFMGNDDIMCEGAMSHVHELIGKYPNIGMVLKSYAWFDGTPDAINQEVRYFKDPVFLKAGQEAISICFRRGGVISGYITHRDAAFAASTDRFDGSLFYQMHMTASVLHTKNAITTPKVLVLCRNGEPPDFGNSANEKGKFQPGSYTPEARLRMVGGALAIAKHFEKTTNIQIYENIVKDYANYFFPYIRDQLGLPLKDYAALYKSYAAMGFGKYAMFHIYCVVGYALGERRFDNFTRFVRSIIGRSPQFGIKRTAG